MSETFKPGRGPSEPGDRSSAAAGPGSGRKASAVSSPKRREATSDDLSVLLALFACVLVYAIFFRKQGGKKGRKSRRQPEPYSTLEEVQAAIRNEGLESCNLVLGIDFTRSNDWNQKNSFPRGRSLHDTQVKGEENPYQRVMRIIAKTLAPFDDDGEIPVFGFGDVHTGGTACFPFFPDRPCCGLDEVLDRYNQIVEDIQKSGPTNFGPVIRKAIEIVKETKQYHVLVIIADGQVDRRQDTISAIVEASKHPLSIVVVGVGDGPWETMEAFDDDIPQRKFDNFQFVDFGQIEREHRETLEPSFACMALMELPAQYAAIRRLGLL